MPLILRPKDFERMAKAAEPASGTVVPIVDVVVDRFGVVPEGKAIMVQTPVQHEMKRMEFVPLLSPEPLREMRYIGMLEFRIPEINVGVEAKAREVSPREAWAALWRWSTLAAREQMQRRLDRRSSVRRSKRAEELAQRKRRRQSPRNGRARA